MLIQSCFTFRLKIVEVAAAYNNLADEYQQNAQVLSRLHVPPEAAHADEVGKDNHEALEHLADGHTGLNDSFSTQKMPAVSKIVPTTSNRLGTMQISTFSCLLSASSADPVCLAPSAKGFTNMARDMPANMQNAWKLRHRAMYIGLLNCSFPSTKDTSWRLCSLRVMVYSEPVSRAANEIVQSLFIPHIILPIAFTLAIILISAVAYKHRSQTVSNRSNQLWVFELIILLMTSVNKDPVYVESPRRILSRAKHLANTIEEQTELKQESKIAQLKELAERRKDDIKMAIEYSKQQNELFRKLEEEDVERRRSLHKSIEQKVDKISSKKDQYLHKRETDTHKLNEGKSKKLHKFHQSEERYHDKCAEKAKQLTSNMLQFHKKQMQDMKTEWERLKGLKTCHRMAQSYIDRRERKKEKFAMDTLKDLDLDFQKNSKKENPQFRDTIRKRSRRLSQAWKTSCDFYSNKHNHFLQTFCSDLDTAEDMKKAKQEDFKKTSQRINKFLKERSGKWAKLKNRVDEKAAHVPEKCLDKINKSVNGSTLRASSPSSFYDTCETWRRKNDRRKQHLRQIQTQRDNRILDKHLDTTRRNKDEDSLNNTMTDMMMRASFHAKEFL